MVTDILIYVESMRGLRDRKSEEETLNQAPKEVEKERYLIRTLMMVAESIVLALKITKNGSLSKT